MASEQTKKRAKELTPNECRSCGSKPRSEVLDRDSVTNDRSGFGGRVVVQPVVKDSGGGF